jgi:hypothetical protein
MEKLDIGLDEAFQKGLPAEASSEQLQKWLMNLCSGFVPNENVRHREIIRGITINHIILQRHIDNLNKQNNRLQWLVVALTIASLMGTGVQIYTVLKYSKQSTHNVMEQVLPKSEAAKSKLIQDEKTKEDQGKTPPKSLNIYGK